MSLLVFSDTHFTKNFEQKRFDALHKLIAEADGVIINGDFWEGQALTFTEFLDSGWNKLFPELKQKNAIYIYGNHDLKTYSDSRVLLFCNQAVDQYELVTPTRSYLFRHGHQFLFPKHLPTCLERQMKNRGTARKKFWLTVAATIQRVGFGLFGPKVLPNIFNSISKKARQGLSAPEQLLVCGHTHRPACNLNQNFLNTGFVNFGWINCLMISNLGDFELLSKRY